MANTIRQGYDTSIGTEERSARSATKVYGIILALVFLIGLVLLGVLYNSRSTGTGPSGTAPASRTDSSGQSPGP
jgi:hypothetical protein